MVRETADFNRLAVPDVQPLLRTQQNPGLVERPAGILPFIAFSFIGRKEEKQVPLSSCGGEGVKL